MDFLRAPIAILFVAAVAIAQQRPPHWSYQRVERPPLPSVRNENWSKVPFDRFVLARLEQIGNAPAPAAERAIWLRRTSLDLCGLPPKPESVAAFAADLQDGAFERAADRLLAEPAFGERWAQMWLDLARYADSQGYEKDDLRPDAWRYRDWVISAFGRDLPFDHFTLEQLAGDLLPGPSIDQLVATAFHRQTMTNTEGGTDDEEFRTDAVIDRINTTMSVWMGSTVGCAQCHDHKYDPFSQREFYQLFAFFDQTEDNDQPDEQPTMRAPNSAQMRRTTELQQIAATLREQLRGDKTAIAAFAKTQRERLASAAAAITTRSPWHLLGPLRGASFDDAFDRPRAPELQVRLDEEQEGQRWQEREDFGDGKVHTFGGDNSANYLYRTIQASAAATVVLSVGHDDALRVQWNGREVFAKKSSGAAMPDQELLEVTLKPGNNELLLKVVNGGGIGGFYFDLRASQFGAVIEAALQKPEASCCEADLLTIREAYSRFAGELAPARALLVECERELASLLGPLVPVLRELPKDRARTTRIHLRGSFLNQGDPVSMDVPACFPPLPQDAPKDRLALAKWLVSRDNPLTARVQVNRFWEELFGRGLVVTSEDFGRQGEPPLQRELLDWLSVEFMECGWSVKQLLRTIVLSATYRQSSVALPGMYESDPYNDLLARGASFRLSGETLRDQALAVSGLLSKKLLGPSVMPQQPDGIWGQMYSGLQWQTSAGEDQHRRSLYTLWRRTSPHPAMTTFDAPSREFCVLRRLRTNTPLQALVTWNDPQFFECAEALAQRTLRECPGDDAAKIAHMLQLVLQRAPTPAELQRMLLFVSIERERLGSKDSVLPWTLCANVLLNLDEFVTKG
ncbi:MAG: DUF1549 and DUF1553 domain-containing protein [Planctomycetota bacterium]|nr:DUF1549 and DUF1553 domain-containing protein [Planctomycetota bacterium]